MTTVDDVLVVGAGPVGLTAACQLARLGVAVRVVEKLERPTTESRAVGVHARSLEMLASLGVLPALEARGRRMEAVEMVNGVAGTTLVRLDLADAPTRHPYVLDVAQPDTEDVLADRAAELGVVVERGVELIGLTQDDDGVDVILRTGAGDRSRRVGWVIGADGGHSATRHLVDSPLHGEFHGQHFAMADVDVDTSYAPTSIRMFTHPDGMGALFPLAGARARVMFFVDAPAPEAGDPTLEQMQALADIRMGGKIRLSNPRWLTHFEVHHGQVEQYRHGRVFLAGDAAHIHSPAGAQGMNTGIQDAANLAWKLALVVTGRAGADLLDSYHDERHPVGAAVVRMTTKQTAVGTLSGPAATLRNLVLSLVGHVHVLTEAIAEEQAEVTVNYRDSALVEHHGTHHHGAARAGDHAPDPDGLLRPDGSPVAIEDLLARPGMLLLVRGDVTAVDELREALGDLGTTVRVVADPAEASTDDVVDLHGVLDRAYGLRSNHGDTMALVRPDGYLGLVGAPADAAMLREHLATRLQITRPAPVRAGA